MSRPGRGGTALAVGSAVNGLLAYGVFALTTRGLGAEAAAPVAVLWSVWALCGAALTFPLQHWLTTLATPSTPGTARPRLGVTGPPVVAAALLVGAAAVVLREQLFGRTDFWFPALAAALAGGAGVIGLVRGVLAAEGRFTWLAASLAAENAVRCAAVLGLVLAGSTAPVAYGVCLLSGFVVAAAVPVSWRGRAAGARPGSGPWGFLAGAGSAQLAHQVVLTGGPVAAATLGAQPAAVTGLFAALALFRAPYLVAVGVAPSVTRTLSVRWAAGDMRGLRSLLRRGVLASAVAAVLAVAVAWWLGPPVLRLVFGEVAVTPLQAALVASGCVLAVANLMLGIVTLVVDRPALGARAWLAAGAVGALFLLGSTSVPWDLDVADGVAAAFLGAEAAAFVLLAAGTVGAGGDRAAAPS